MMGRERLNRQKNARWILKVHRRLIKPPYPTMIACPNCGHNLIIVNSDLIEIENSFGLSELDLTAHDAWSQQRHTCGAKIALFWKD